MSEPLTTASDQVTKARHHLMLLCDRGAINCAIRAFGWNQFETEIECPGCKKRFPLESAKASAEQEDKA